MPRKKLCECNHIQNSHRPKSQIYKKDIWIGIKYGKCDMPNCDCKRFKEK